MSDGGTSANILAALILSGLMGLLGQGIRAAVGLKGAGRVPGSSIDQQSEFSAAYFALSLMIGFIAGMLAGLVIGLDKITALSVNDAKILLGIAASGYAGAD